MVSPRRYCSASQTRTITGQVLFGLWVAAVLADGRSSSGSGDAPGRLKTENRVVRRESRSAAALAVDGHGFVDAVGEELPQKAASRPLELLGSELQQRQRVQRQGRVQADGSTAVEMPAKKPSKGFAAEIGVKLPAGVPGLSADLGGSDEEGNATLSNMSDMINNMDKLIVEKAGVVRSMSDAFAYILVGTAMLLTSIVYLTNSSHLDIKAAVWKTLSGGMSIFAAIMLYYAEKEGWNKFIFGADAVVLEDQSDGRHPSMSMAAQACLRLFVNYVIVMLGLWWTLGHPAYRAVVGELGSHIIGFTAADAFGEIQFMHPVCDDPAYALGLVIPVFACGFVARRFGTWWRSFFAVDPSAPGAALYEEWQGECDECETEFVGFAVGLLMSQVCRYHILGVLPPLEGLKRKQQLEESQIMELAGFAMCFAVIVVIIGLIVHMYGIDIHGHSGSETILSMIQNCSSMSMAWCLVFWGKWSVTYYMGHVGYLPMGVKLADKIYQAIFFTPLMFICIYICDKIGEGGGNLASLKCLINGFVLVIGLTWEKTFIGAMESLEDARHMDKDSSINTTILHNLIVFVFVVPAWGLYIQPKSRSLAAQISQRQHSTDDQPAAAAAAGGEASKGGAAAAAAGAATAS
eukprot:TRINITY_DN29148_c0_g1_i1.p1 TRINITY_DN29148_c0_g1~~TRINITY_DN29148_c0_g1_i1.p1  ORF type:complete len:634 (-),score=172.49 TRINITY_DN29148_c0_g1_i1:129-2030(-)